MKKYTKFYQKVQFRLNDNGSCYECESLILKREVHYKVKLTANYLKDNDLYDYMDADEKLRICKDCFKFHFKGNRKFIESVIKDIESKLALLKIEMQLI